MPLFLLAYSLSSFALLLPAQRFIQLFAKDKYARKPFFGKLREDPSALGMLNKYWLICLSAQILLLAAVTLFLIYVLDFTYGFAILLLSFVFLAAMAWLSWRWKWRDGVVRPEGKRVALINLTLFLEAVLTHVLVLMVFVVLTALAGYLFPGLAESTGTRTSSAVAFSIVQFFIPYFCFLLAEYLLVALLPRFLALAVAITQSMDPATSKKKD
jgi:hypothetical protein